MSHRQEQIQCYIPSSSQPTLTHVSRCITLKPEARGWKDPDFKANLSYLMRPHLKNQTKSKKKRENILNGWIMYHVKSAWMKASQMKASRSFRWKSSASQLIITRKVRALFFFLSLYISSFFESPDWQSGLSPTHFTKFASRTEALRERWWGQETRQVVLRTFV